MKSATVATDEPRGAGAALWSDSLMRTLRPMTLVLLVALFALDGRSPRATHAQAGVAASPQVVAELSRTLTDAIGRFEAMDAEGLLASFSDRYRSGGLTKAAVRQDLQALYAANDAVHARIRIDEVQIVGDRAWVWSTGQVTGRVRVLGTTLILYSWERLPEVAWREDGRWRLIGDQN